MYVFQTFRNCETNVSQKKKNLMERKFTFSHSFRGFSHGGKDMVEGSPRDG